MRIYVSPTEMIREVERDLFEMGTRYQSATVQDKDVHNDEAFRTIELTGYSYCLTAWSSVSLDAMLKYPGVRDRTLWVHAEAPERLFSQGQPLNPGQAWKLDPSWAPFLRDGKFSYTYAERWQYQLPYVIEELRARPYTRQAVLTMYDVHQDMMNWGGRDRVPCSLSYHFLRREDRLSLIYSQRSCDFVNFFAPDVYFATRLLEHVCESTGTPRGMLIHNLNSLHAFKGDLDGRNIF